MATFKTSLEEELLDSVSHEGAHALAHASQEYNALEEKLMRWLFREAHRRRLTLGEIGTDEWAVSVFRNLVPRGSGQASVYADYAGKLYFTNDLARDEVRRSASAWQTLDVDDVWATEMISCAYSIASRPAWLMMALSHNPRLARLLVAIVRGWL